MIIRCERCSTVYELDDGVVPPDGTDVQCTRCEHVFTARPPQAKPPPTSTTARSPQPQASAAGAASPGRRPAVYRPPTSQPAQQVVPRTPVLRRDTVGTFESRLRWSHRWRWLAPTLFVGAAAAGVFMYLARGVTVEQGAEEPRAQALTLALADDVQSLEQAATALQRVIDSSPQAHAARADHALVELLLAGALSEPEAKGPRRERARKLAASATATLDELARANLARPEVARARAVAASLSPNRAELKRLVTAARAELPSDAIVAIAEYGADVRSTDRSVRDRAVSELGLLLARRPELARAKYLLAKGLALEGRRNEALAAAEELLKRNPRHEGALGLRETITRPPPTAPIAPPGAAPAPGPDVAAATQVVPQPARVEKPGALPRNVGSTRGETIPAPSAESAADAAPAGAAGAGAEPAPAESEPPPPPRLRPVAVPEPEVVEGGG